MATVAAHSLGSDVERPNAVIAGRYRLRRPIATGGMATIWEATHLALHRSIALKFIAIAGTSQASIQERFLREARVAAAVRHRNVVDILDFGTAEDGRPFMAMELLVGQTLAHRMDKTLPTATEAVQIVAQLLSGLAAVHDAGIVHRDLKPENVFLAEDGDGVVVPKLLDFGVSRAMDPSGVLKSVLPTRENVIVGTPQYMSPEQARGLVTIDYRSDLWSAGVILFELLTGVLPFDGEAIGDVIVQIATKEPPDLATLRPDLAGPLADVVKKAMTRDPDERWQDAREMRRALLHAAAETTRIAADRDALLAAAQEPGDSGLISLFPDRPLDRGPASDAAQSTLPAETLEPRATQPAEPPRATSWRSPRRFAVLTLLAGLSLAILGLTVLGSVLAEPETDAPPLAVENAARQPMLPPAPPPEREEPQVDEIRTEAIAAPAPELLEPPPARERARAPTDPRPSPPPPIERPVPLERGAQGLLRDPGF